MMAYDEIVGGVKHSMIVREVNLCSSTTCRDHKLVLETNPVMMIKYSKMHVTWHSCSNRINNYGPM